MLLLVIVVGGFFFFKKDQGGDLLIINQCKEDCNFITTVSDTSFWYFKSISKRFETQNQCLDYCKINNQK